MNVVVDIYGRVSTQEQAQEGYSIKEQESRLRMYVQSQGWIIHDVCMDGGFSGASLNRPGIQKVISDAENHRINKVAVYKLDRLSRSQKDTLHLIEDVFIKNDVDFVSMTESLDTSTPLGLAMIGILSVFAQLEREQIKERMQMGVDASVKSGKLHGNSNEVIGYDFDPKTRILKQNEYDAMMVRNIYQMYIDGMSESAIARWLTDRNWRGHEWRAAKVKRTLQQPLYVGRQRWKGETVAVEGCPNILSDEVWEQAQAEMTRRDSRKQVRPQRAGEHATMLGGILWCGCCGNRFCGERTSGNYYYYCYSRRFRTHKLKAPDCDNKGWNAAILDDIVLGQIRQLKTNRDILEDNTSMENRREQLETLQGRLKTIDEQQERLVKLYTLGTIDTTQIAKQSANLSDEKERVQKMIEELNKAPTTLSTEDFYSTANGICELVDTGSSSKEVGPLARKLIQSVTVTYNDVKIVWNFTK